MNSFPENGPGESAEMQARVDLAAAYRLADQMRLSEGIDNHFTYMVPGSNTAFLTHPYGLHFSEIRASDLREIDGVDIENAKEGESYWAERTAFYIHWSLHKARPDARCIIHLHMPYATALCLIPDGRLEMSFQNAMRFYGKIAYVEDYDGIQIAEEQGALLAEAVKGTDKRIIMHRHHGVIVMGETVADAFEDTYYLERTCWLQFIAKSYAGKLATVSDNVAASIASQFDDQYAQREMYAQKHFDAMKRVLSRTNPGFAE